MILFVLILLAILVMAWLLGRRQAPGVATLHVRALWLAPLALVLQAPLWTSHGDAVWQSTFFLFSYGLLFTFCALNWHLVPVRLLAIGFLLNFLVVMANDGFMPITPEALSRINPGTMASDWPAGVLRAGSKDIVLPAAQTRLYLLSDILILPPPFPLPTAFSPGDVMILLGFAALSLRIMSVPSRAAGRQHMEMTEVSDAV